MLSVHERIQLGQILLRAHQMQQRGTLGLRMMEGRGRWVEGPLCGINHSRAVVSTFI